MSKPLRTLGHVLVLAVACAVAQPAAADLSAFVALVGFDDDANLDSAPGVGLRWGKSSGILGGETSLLISRPERQTQVPITGETVSAAATAIFYEGRLILNIPVGEWQPFVNVGYGAVTILPGTLKPSTDPGEAAGEVLNALEGTQTNQTFSYGAGVRYALNSRIDARFDLRQYQVFSVTGAVVRQVAGDTAADLLEEEENTVQYSELSAGIVFRF